MGSVQKIFPLRGGVYRKRKKKQFSTRAGTSWVVTGTTPAMDIGSPPMDSFVYNSEGYFSHLEGLTKITNVYPSQGLPMLRFNKQFRPYHRDHPCN